MKTLVIYYSKTGRTEKLAEQISGLVDGTLFELVPARRFPSDMYDTADVANEQYAHNQLPTLKEIPDLNQFDRILVGSPVWSGRLATPVASFFQDAQFTDQSVAVFCTSVGQVTDLETDVHNAVQGGQLKPGLITGVEPATDEQIRDWLA